MTRTLLGLGLVAVTVASCAGAGGRPATDAPPASTPASTSASASALAMTAATSAPGGPTPRVSLQGFDEELASMTEAHWIDRKLATFKPTRMSPNDFPNIYPPTANASREAEAFGDELASKLREPAQAAVALAMLPDREASATRNAWQLLAELEDAAIAPLAQARFADPADRVRAATIAVAAELALRAKVAAAIEPLLNERARPAYPFVKPMDAWNVSEKAWWAENKGRINDWRFCDQAYLFLRDLHHPAASERAWRDDQDAYHRLSDADRDQVIAAARASGNYKQPKGPKP